MSVPTRSPFLAATIALTCAPAVAQLHWLPQPSASPSPIRSYSHLAYDRHRDVVVRFGGWDGNGGTNETWEWNRSRWVQRSTTNSPPPRAFYGTIVYDPDRRHVVLFGGGDAGGVVYGDTWVFDGTDWTDVTPTSGSPGLLRGAALTWDPVRRVVLLFGGTDGNGDVTDGTWEWDGSSWSRRVTGTSPPARTLHRLEWDHARGVALLFGGGQPTPTSWNALNDTWQWDGSTWTQLQPATTPPPRSHFGMTWDDNAGAIVLFGGFDPNLASRWRGDTWTWNGADWVELASPRNPSPRCCPGFVHDPTRGVTVLFGGCDNLVVGDTWLLRTATTAATRDLGPGCAATGSTPPRLAAVAGSNGPTVGDEWRIDVTNVPRASPIVHGTLGAATTSWNGSPLPFRLDGLGMTGCTLYVAPELPWSNLALGGRSVWLVRIPLDPDLVGATFGLQLFATEPSANPLGVVVSNGIESTIGTF